MMKNVSYLLFGGIKWRMKGFLIGVGVGLALGSFIPPFIQDWIPQANAADNSIYSSDSFNLDSINGGPYLESGTYQPMSVGFDHFSFPFVTRGVVFTADQSGNISSVTLRPSFTGDDDLNGQGNWRVMLSRLDINTLPADFYENGYDSNNPPVSDMVGDVMGLSPWQDYQDIINPVLDQNDPLYSDPLDPWVFPPYTLDLAGPGPDSLYVEEGEAFILFVQQDWAPQSGNNLTNSTITLTSQNYSSHKDIIGYEGYTFICDDTSTIPSDCRAFEIPRAYNAYFQFGESEQPVDYWQISEPPHIADNQLQYDLSYNCFLAGSIWAYDPDEDNDYIDTGVDCDSNENGFLNLLLSGSFTHFKLAFEPVAFPGQLLEEYDIFITYDEDAPEFPDDYDPAQSSFCINILQDDDFDDDDESAVISGFFSVMANFFDVPVLGDYLTFNCWIKAGIIDNLSIVDPQNVDLKITVLGDTDNLSLNLQNTKNQLYNSFSQNPSYDSFRFTVTMIFWGLIAYLLWHSYANHHKDDEQ